MRRIIAVLTTTLLVALGAPTLFAHDSYRIVGSLTKAAEKFIDVKTREGRTIGIRVDKQTVVLRDKKKIPQTDLKSGQYVVVDGYGDGEDDLLAIEIQIVPAPAR